MTPCKDGKHTLKEIHVTAYGLAEKVTRWCKYCGAITVDWDRDDGTVPGHFMPMQFPEICRVGCIGSEEK